MITQIHCSLRFSGQAAALGRQIFSETDQPFSPRKNAKVRQGIFVDLFEMPMRVKQVKCIRGFPDDITEFIDRFIFVFLQVSQSIPSQDQLSRKCTWRSLTGFHERQKCSASIFVFSGFPRGQV
jgi:hypothetical protein